MMSLDDLKKKTTEWRKKIEDLQDENFDELEELIISLQGSLEEISTKFEDVAAIKGILEDLNVRFGNLTGTIRDLRVYLGTRIETEAKKFKLPIWILAIVAFIAVVLSFATARFIYG